MREKINKDYENNTGAPIWAECVSQTKLPKFSEPSTTNDLKIFFV